MGLSFWSFNPACPHGQFLGPFLLGLQLKQSTMVKDADGNSHTPQADGRREQEPERGALRRRQRLAGPTFQTPQSPTESISSWFLSTHSPPQWVLPTQTDKCSGELRPTILIKAKEIQIMSRDRQYFKLTYSPTRSYQKFKSHSPQLYYNIKH